MGQDTGLRNPVDRFLDWWAELDMWSRYGLSFVGALAFVCAVFVILNWLA